jgi:hypothetical protein
MIGGAALVLLGVFLAALWSQQAPSPSLPGSPPTLRLVTPVMPEDLER